MDLIVGTAGHIDHGKTALVRALTGTDTDRLPEEKQRGITVDLGFAELTIGDIHAGFVDVPGHERFVKNMLAGAAGIDVVLLVVAADEGVMPQTREHFEIVRLLGIRQGIVALTKSDLVDEETLELARLDVHELIQGSFMEASPVITVSSRTRVGLAELTEKIAEAAKMLGRTDRGLAARLPIDRSFSMKGFGTVVTGTLASGSIGEGDELELLPAGRRVRVRGVQVHGQKVSTAPAYRRVAVNLAGVDVEEASRGMTLAEPSTLRPTRVVDASVETLPDLPRALRSRHRVRVHIGSAEVLARLQIIGPDTEIGAGSDGLVQLRFESEVVTFPGERFILRSYSPPRTIGGGEVIGVDTVKHRRRDLPTVTEQLNKLRSTGGLAERLLILLKWSGPRGIDLAELQRTHGVSTAALDSAISDLHARGAIETIGETVIDREVFAGLSRDIANAVSAFHVRDRIARGVNRLELKSSISPYLSEAIFESAVNALMQSGILLAERDVLMSAQNSVAMSPAETALQEALMRAFDQAGLEPPKVDQIIAGAITTGSMSANDARRIVQRMLSDKQLIKVTDEYWFAAAAVDELKRRLRDFADRSPERIIDMAEFKEIAGVSRKYAIPLIEYLDRERFTVRRGDKRVIL